MGVDLGGGWHPLETMEEYALQDLGTDFTSYVVLELADLFRRVLRYEHVWIPFWNIYMKENLIL